jgi:hypothetical protein
MRRSSNLAAWALRLAFLGLILTACLVQFGERTKAYESDITGLSRQVLERAGYRVETGQQTWLKGRVVGRAWLKGSHPLCAASVMIWSLPTSGALNQSIPGPAGAPSSYIYGDWSGLSADRLAILEQTALMHAHFLLSLGRGQKPPAALLVVSDPSGCLALVTPQWRKIWYG